MPDIPVEEVRRLEEISRKGDDLRDFKNSRGYGALVRYVLDPIKQRAFDDFESIKADDTVSIIETQMQKKVVDMILMLIDAGISEGDLAKHNLKDVLP